MSVQTVMCHACQLQPATHCVDNGREIAMLCSGCAFGEGRDRRFEATLDQMQRMIERTENTNQRDRSPHLIRVLEIAPPDGRYCFQPKAMPFMEVDWFQDSLAFVGDPGWDQVKEEMGRELEECSITTEAGRAWIRDVWLPQKRYFRRDRAYLVLHPKASFTVGYTP